MWMERRGAANATRIITDSQVSADEIHRFLGFPTDRLHVVPLAASRLPASSAVPVTERENLVIASGARRPYKNWDALVRALARVDPDVRPRLVITGGSDEDPLRHVVDETGLHDWVELRGWVETHELDGLYRRARAMAMPTLAEGSVSLCSRRWPPGCRCSRPTSRSCVRSAVRDAWWFDPFDLDSIAEALHVVGAEPERLAPLAAGGARRAAPFTWARVADQTLDVFDQVLGERAR